MPFSLRSAILPLLLLLAMVALSSVAGAVEVMKVAEVRGMSRAEAAERREVKLRGVVTMAFPQQAGSFVLDDGECGIFVNRSQEGGADAALRGLLPVGTRVEVTGRTTEKGYSRDVVATEILRLGEGPVPPARPVTVDDLLGGHLDCQRVTISGVVKSLEMRTSAPRVRLTLGTRGWRTLPALLMEVAEVDARRLLDAEVEITGVATTFFNDRAELIGVTVQVQNLGGIRVTAPPTPRGELEVRGLETVRQFSPDEPSPRRLKVRGTVTYSRPGMYFYLQDGTHALRAEARDGVVPAPGDVVEVAGYPEVRDYFAELTGAEVTKVGTAAVPAPERVTREDILRRSHPSQGGEGMDGKRVEISARLEKVQAMPGGGRRFFLNHGGGTVFASLPDAVKGEKEPPVGSGLVVAGICVLELNTRWPAVDWSVPQDFQLLVQSATDVRVTERAPWWTVGRVMTALSVMAVAALAAVVWVMLLRRQVRAQTETIRRQSARETLAEERSRMAREFHDTLEQELTGLSIQLDAASDSLPESPGQALGALESARNLLDYTRGEARRSIWDLRSLALQERGLFGALEWSAEQFRGEGMPDIRLAHSGTPCRMSPRVESHLLRIGTECLTNAVKHAGAAVVEVELAFREGGVALRVADDGKGFRLPGPGEPVSGHFGLRGMRERAAQIGAELEVRSAPGEGTMILVDVPRTRVS